MRFTFSRFTFSRVTFSLIATLLIALAIVPAHAETRIALVVGNGAYQHLRALPNPPNDARDLADALRRLDFEVDLGVDLTLTDMQRKVTTFARRAQTADVALAFFAGHGVQAPDPLGGANSVNYLLPVDSDIKDAADLRFLPTARDIIARLQAANSVRILILDACRDNPIAQQLGRGRGASVSRGLSPEPKTNGTLIAYSTQPGTIAEDGVDRNSAFVRALLDHIAEPGLDIRLLFADVRRDVTQRSHGMQTPETSDSLDGRFMFNKSGSGTVTANLSPPPAAPAPSTAAPATSEPPRLVYSQWVKLCGKGPDPNAKELCITGKDGRTEQGQPVVAAALLEPTGEPKKLLRIALWSPLQLQFDTRLIVDQDPPISGALFTCFANGCMADYEATPELVAKLKKGQLLQIQVINLATKAVATFPLPLSDTSGNSFQKANEGPPTYPTHDTRQKKLEEDLQKRAEELRRGKK
jgi:invasion protein IalB